MNALVSAQNTVQISHESETQRQYPRLSLPARAVVNGKKYEVRNLSTGGIALSPVGDGFSNGKTLSVDLQLAFGSFSLNMTLDAEVMYYDIVGKILGCRFINQTPEQVSFLNQSVKAFISGDIVTAGGILNIAHRNNFTKTRPPANKNTAAFGLRRQLPGLFAVLLIGILITVLLAENLYTSIFIVKAGDAVVAGPVISVRAMSTGIYHSRLDPTLTLIRQNQTIGTISPTAGGIATTIQSPCDCYISKIHLTNGEPVSQNQQIMSLLPIDAKPWIVAEIDASQGKKIGPDSLAAVSIFGSRNSYAGRVISMESPLSGTRDNGSKAVLMKISLDQKLPVDFVNRLADVTFNIH